MKIAKLRDAWLITMIAALVLGFGYSQTSTKPTTLTSKAYTIAISMGSQLQLLNSKDRLPTSGKALICQRVVDLTAARLGHNCKSPIKNLASINTQ